MTKSGRILYSLLATLLTFAPLVGQSQQGTIVGRVFDTQTEQPLPGVTIQVGDRGVLSGQNGRFILTGAPAGEHVLRATLIGYAAYEETVRVIAGETVTVQIGLESEAIELDRIVVTGYGEQRAADLTGAIKAVGQEEFNTGRVISPEDLILGKVAGLQIVESGEPGGGTAIRIRGGTSVNASNEPLFVIDGVPLPVGGGLSSGRNPLNFLNPDDIESITVLKDASATAIYGSRGANGVIMVETRQGSVTAPTFTFGSSISTSMVTRTPEVLSASQYRQVVEVIAPQLEPYLGDADTDWQSYVLRNGIGQEHSVAASGASDDINYRLSLNYLEQEGVIEGSLTERVSAALTSTHRMFDNQLVVQANLRGARTDDQYTPGGGLGAATAFNPTLPVRDENGGFVEQEEFFGPNNPIAELELAVEEGTTFRGLASVEGEYQLPFVEDLSATVRLGYDVASSERRTFYPTVLWGQQQRGELAGYVNRSNPRETTGLLDFYMDYGRFLGGSPLQLTAGYSYESSRGDYPFFEASGLSSDLLGTSGVPTALEPLPRVNVRENKLASFFARANYQMMNRYIFMASIRRDGSSRFGPGNQWGTYPAAAFAWRLTEEPFLDGFDRISDLKLRISWGMNGNQAIGDYLWAADYRYGDPFAQYQFGDDYVTTIRPTAVDPNIKWEETSSANFGIDFGFYDNRITGSLEYYIKDTDDLIFRVPVAAGTNVSNFVTTNIGSMRNQGVELALEAGLIEGGRNGFNWDVNFTASTNDNELLRISPFSGSDERILTGGIAGGVGSTIQVLQPGLPINTFLVYEHKFENGQPVNQGNPSDMYVDQPTAPCPDDPEALCPDGIINEDDRVPFENPQPNLMLGHTSRLSYDRVGLSFTMRAQLGNYVYNNVAASHGYFDRLLEAAGPVNLHESVLDYQFQGAQYFSNVYVEDASFLRMDNLTLDYTLPRAFGAGDIRIYGSVQNLFTLTGYSGVDPESGLNGIDNNLYPRARTFTTGVNFAF